MISSDDRMNTNMQAALDDPEVEHYLRKSLLAGYRNMGLPNADKLVDAIFAEFEKNPNRLIGETLEVIRNQISATWVNGGSVKDYWSQYYKDHEAPFITNQIISHVTGKRILEIGTGRGWISYHLAKALGPDVSITQTDVTDYREPSIRGAPQFNFVQISMDDPLPFEPNSFDTVIVVYVLHHHPDGAARESFLRKLSEVAKERLIIFEDTYLKSPITPNFSEPQMDVMTDFLRLTEQQKINALSFQCSLSNRVDGGGASVPTPCTFHDFDSLVRELKDASGVKTVESHFLGIPRSKIYLNTEGVFIIQK
ncbi:MAG: hypothetical protein A3I05_02450 [Deltaproteobacteria bacterium RIFCSPLOWO2_02_FULL_44_10]|nr:MAG: hypothetical protein A3I05_02450 [Deltaproteobacteria bacterium RIFCSPLOWO2_02_FULL_44_10]